VKAYPPKDIRNVALVGHGHSGKTTLTEALLFAAGHITRLGKIEDGNTVSDHEPEEIKKQISVSLALAPVEWDGVKINLLDAPGYADFIGDVKTALRAADACLFVVSAVDGVEVQHEVIWELAVEAGLPRAFFVNKLDRERASYQRTLQQLTDAFGTQVAPVQFPIGEENDLEGIVYLLSRRAFRYPSGPMGVEGDWPEDLSAKVEPYRTNLIDAVAEADDSLLEAYLETGELDADQVVRGVRDGFAQAKLAPVLCGSASSAKPIGVDRLAEFIRDVFPTPLDRPPAIVLSKSGEAAERAVDPSGPLTGLVFKTISDPYVGKISLVRVASGTLRPDSSVHNSNQNLEERVGQLFTLRGKEHESVSEVPAGDIGAIAKLAKTTTGDTLTAKGDDARFPSIELPEPLYAVAVEPKTKGDEDKLSIALHRAVEEDPTVHIERSDETHQTVLYGMGEAHVDVLLERMKRKFGVEVATLPAKIAYKETIRGPGKGLGRHVKQSGGHGQYGVCHIEVEPLPRGGGFEYVDKIVGGVIPNQWITSVEKGVVKAMSEGAVSGNPMVDIRCTLFDGKFHPVDSSDIAFQIAGALALREAAQAAGVVLLEPIADVEITVPDEFAGDIMGDLNSRRGRIQGMGEGTPGKQVVKASVPQAEMARYAIDLRSMTHGRGAFTMKVTHYEEVPAHLADKIIEEAKRAREEAKA
jgi:elongation factor G